MNGWMPTLSRSSEPKYRAIAHAYAQAIHGGQMLPGEKLPAHRLLAKKLSVTTGTVSRAYAELERCGMVVARVGDGTYVAEPDADGARMPDRAQPAPESRERAAAITTGAPGALTGTLTAALTAARLIDLGQNVPMPTDEAFLLTQTLRELAADERLAGELLL
ncbi:MAG TPA: GntR family transcriptional regulator, partial [Paraburkholderia sp.]